MSSTLLGQSDLVITKSADKVGNDADPTAAITNSIRAIGEKVDGQLKNIPTLDQYQKLDKDLKDAQQELKTLKADIKVRDAGDDIDLPRFNRLRNFKSEKDAYGFGCVFLAGIARETPNLVKNPVTAQKALEYAKNHGLIVEKASLNEGTNTVGGYLVNDQFINRIVDLREQYGVGRSLMRNEPMSSDTLSFNRRTGGLTVYPLGESTSITESGLTFDRVGLTAKKWGTYTLLTSELNEDAIISMADRLAGEIAYAFASNEDDCIFNGDGTATYQGIQGIRPALKTINGVDEGGGLILQTSNAFADITKEDFERLIGVLPQYADGPNCRFVCHRVFWATVMARLAYAVGGTSKSDVATAMDRTFMGYPVTISQKYPSSDTASVVYCTFGDHSLAGTFGNRRATTIAFSVDFKFQTDEIAVRSTTRWDAVWHDLGTATVAGPVVGLMSSAS